MPLVKGRKITVPSFMADGAELPGDGAILVSGERFLGDPTRWRRAGKLGVIWPNNRDVDDLGALSRSAGGGRAGVSVLPRRPRLQPGAAAARTPRLCGELRATGQVLRDQFVFMLRAGFDAFEVKKEPTRTRSPGP